MKKAGQDGLITNYNTPRGKDRASTEFRSKQLVMLKDGYAHVCKMDWNNYNDGVWLAAYT